MSKIDLRSLNLDELENIIVQNGMQKFRAKQIYKWIYSGVESFADMTNISNEMQQKLETIFYISTLELVKVQESVDGTKKFLFKLPEGDTIESVLMHYEHGYSVCISTQVGCKMGCRFCASTGAGFNRNLTAGEIVGQLLKIQKEEKLRISNVVFMGIGEPLDNFENTLKALQLLNDEQALNIGYRHISVSTSGLVPKIKELAKHKLPITLSISLHAPNDETRNQIMPVNRAYGVKELISTCKEYTRETGRRISYEYIMLKGINDRKEDAIELANLLKGEIAHVNLIPYNEVPGVPWKRSPDSNIKKFMVYLENLGITVTRRRSLGQDITAACGQLRKKNKEKK